MAGTTSKYLSDALLNWEKGTPFPTAPAATYVALLTTMPTKNDGTALVEVSTTATGYARQAVTFGAITTQGDNQTEQMSNSAQITFPVATASWGTVVGVGIYDAATGGNLLWWNTLSTGTQVINSGNQFALPAGNLPRTQS